MNLILFDHSEIREHLLPLTFSRPVSTIRIGIMTIQEKWEHLLKTKASHFTQEYLQALYPLSLASDNLWVNGAVCPDEYFLSIIQSLQPEESLTKNGIPIAIRSAQDSPTLTDRCREMEQHVIIIDRLIKILDENEGQLNADFQRLTASRKSALMDDPFTRTYKAENIFLEEGATVKAAILNAESGPIYLGKNSLVQEGTVIKGPFCLGEYSEIKPNSVMRHDTSIGPRCKVGGEMIHSIILGYSNKSHDGFMGHSVIGEWCNIGADTNTSNLKNNYDFIKQYSHVTEKMESTNRRFYGLIMGDHSKCAINTMFNSGTVVGMCANVFGSDFPPNFIPSFSWGGAAGLKPYVLSKAIETAQRVMERRDLSFTADHAHLFKVVQQITEASRQKFII